MGPEFLGTGWVFPVLPDPAGRLSYAVGEDSIRDCLLVLLQTATGERVMRPDFGAGLNQFVFEPVNPTTLARVDRRVQCPEAC